MINWEKIYKTLIELRGLGEKPKNTYTELHHIIPRYLGGVDEQENLVRLTLSDHTLAHYILWRWKGNLQDRVAFLMKGGQTEKGNIERVKLAVEASREINRERFLNENPMKNPKSTEKAKQTRVSRYKGKYHSEQGVQNLKLLSNTGGQHTPEAVRKRVKSLKKQRILKESITPDGYCYLNLVKNKKQFTFRVHRLVATAFIPNKENKPTVNHIDGIKTNNKTKNLEWATRKEQSQHCLKLGLYNCFKRKVVCIKTGHTFESAVLAAKYFNINKKRKRLRRLKAGYSITPAFLLNF